MKVRNEQDEWAGDELVLIEFSVRGSPSTWPELALEPRDEIAPVGCVIAEYLEVLRLFKAALFVRGVVSCFVGRHRAEPNRVILPGDALTIVRDR